MKRRILKFLTIIFLLISVVNAGYLAIPETLQDKIPFWSDLTAIVIFLTTGAGGTALLFLQDYLLKNEIKQDNRYSEVLNMVLEAVERNNIDKKIITRLEQSQMRTENKINALIKSRLDNPYLTNESEAELEEVINDVEK